MLESVSQNDKLLVKQVIKARWIWTGSGVPIPHGVITLAGSRIAAVSPSIPKDVLEDNVLDLGDVCILPAMINAHTHLEFSDLTNPIDAGASFADWIVRVVQHRKSNESTSRGESTEARHMAGAIEASKLGTALALNVVHGSSMIPSPHHSSLFEIPFPELMATTDLRRQQTWRLARSMMRECVTRNSEPNSPILPLRMGLSPHAPYTTTGRLVQQTVDHCCRFGLPLMMHLAESQEEMNWIANGTGPLQEMLESIVGPTVHSTKDRLSVAEYVHEISRAPKSFLIHGNYLQADSWKILANRRGRTSVVFCPRTHRHFGHSSYPLEAMLRNGVRVFLGTDSRASNPDLSILEEARLVYKNFPAIPPETILQMITSDAARFLELDRHFGSINPGAIASFAQVRVDCNSPEQVLRCVLESDDKPSMVELK